MTQKEFRAIDYRKPIVVRYYDELYSVVAVNFEEELFALETNDSADPIWVRRENAELVK